MAHIIDGKKIAADTRADIAKRVAAFEAENGFKPGLAVIIVGYGLTRLEYCRVPKIFRGVPIALIYLGLLSLAFYGLIGHQLPT